MVAAEWGVWHDPDTERGIAAYTDAGLELRTPDQVTAMNDETLQQVARDCGALLQKVYKGTYPLSAGDADALVESVRIGETHVFTLTRDESLVAMACTATVNMSNLLLLKRTNRRFARFWRTSRNFESS